MVIITKLLRAIILVIIKEVLAITTALPLKVLLRFIMLAIILLLLAIITEGFITITMVFCLVIVTDSSTDTVDHSTP